MSVTTLPPIVIQLVAATKREEIQKTLRDPDSRVKFINWTLTQGSEWVVENTKLVRRVVKIINSLYSLDEYKTICKLNEAVEAILAHTGTEKCQRWVHHITQRRIARFEEVYLKNFSEVPTHRQRLEHSLRARDTQYSVYLLEQEVPENLERDHNWNYSCIIDNSKIFGSLAQTNYPLMKKLLFEKGLWCDEVHINAKEKFQSTFEAISNNLQKENLPDFQDIFIDEFTKYAPQMEYCPWHLPIIFKYIGNNQVAFTERLFFSLYNANPDLVIPFFRKVISYCAELQRDFLLKLLQSSFFSLFISEEFNFLVLCKDVELLKIFIKERPQYFYHLLFLPNKTGDLPIHQVRYEVFSLFLDHLNEHQIEDILVSRNGVKKFNPVFEINESRKILWYRKIKGRSQKIFKKLILDTDTLGRTLIHRSAREGAFFFGEDQLEFWELVRTTLTIEEFKQCLKTSDQSNKTPIDYAIDSNNQLLLRFLMIDHPEFLMIRQAG